MTKIIIIKNKKKKPTTVQTCRLENTELKSMKQVSYGGKYSLSANRAHHCHLQFSFLVGDAFYPRFLHAWVFNYCVCRHHLLMKICFFFISFLFCIFWESSKLKKASPTTKENCR